MSFPHIDEHGAITQHPKFGADEGDSAFFAGHFEIARHLVPCIYHGVVKKADQTLYFPDDDGRLVRHAKAKRDWIREKDRGSRDQYTSWICLFTLTGDTRSLKKIAWLLLSRGGFFTNTRKNGQLDVPKKIPDIITPDLISIILRGLASGYAYPLYYVLDFYILFDVLFTRFIRNDSDVANHLAIVLTANEKCPTLISKLALKLMDTNKMRKWLAEYFTIPGHVKKSQELRNPGFVGESLNTVIAWKIK